MIYNGRYFTVRFVWVIDGKRFMWLDDITTGETVFIWEWASTSDRFPY